MKKNRNMNGMLTLRVFPIYHSTPPPACIVYDCREGRGVIIGNTQSVSIPFLFLFFFHQSSLYRIKIFAKCFYLLVVIADVPSMWGSLCSPQLFLFHCNSQTTQATELTQARTQITPPILQSSPIKEGTRHVRFEFPRTAMVSYSTRHRNLASAPGLYAACVALSAATRKGLVSTVRACVKNNIILTAVTTFYHRACGSDVKL